MPIVRTDVPTTSALCDETILALVDRYPFCRTELLGTSAFGNPIRTLVIGQGPRKVLFTAAHHANEWITTPVILKFVEDLALMIQRQDPTAQNIENTATIYTLPMVNPDGVDLVTGFYQPGTLAYETAAALSTNYPSIPFPDGWKANILGVDLNLQYPAGWLRAREIKFSQGFTRPGPRDYVGRAPLNQLEPRLLAGYTEAVDPALVLAFHTQGQVIYWQFGATPVPGARELGERFAAVSGYELADTPEESAYAGYKDWFIQEFGRPGYTIEAGTGTNPLPLSQFEPIYAACAPIMTAAALGE